MRLASSSTEALYRPEDQAFKASFATVGDYHAYGSFFDEQLCNVDYEDSTKAAIGNLGEFMTASSSMVNDFALRPSRSEGMLPSPSQAQPWRKTLWSLSHKPAAQVVVQRTRRQRGGSRPDLLACDNENTATSWSLRSPRASPKAANTKAAPPPRGHEEAMPPSPIYFQLPLHTKMDQSEVWQQDFDDFDLGVNQDQHSQVKTNTNNRSSLPAHTQSLSMAVPVPVPAVSGASAHPDTEIGLALSKYEDVSPDVFAPSEDSTTMDPGLIGQGPHFGASPQLPSSGTEAHSYESLSASAWQGNNSFDSASSSHHSYENVRPAVRGSQSVQNMHELYKKHEQMWASPAQGNRRGRFPIRVHTQHMPEATTLQAHQNHSHMVMSQNTDQGQNGLYFAEQMEHQMEHQAFHEHPHTSLHHSLSTGELPYSPHLHTQQVLNQIPVMPMPLHLSSVTPSPYVTPRKTRVSGSRSPSPSLLPRRQRSPTRGPSEHTLRRRKSIQKLGPIKDLHEPPPLPHNPARTHSRSRSMSKLPKTPKTPTTGTVSMDFVNFTPKDSLKLLSDVAPSGSSKTRARREAEAREKRKKLSEAALRAVSSVGGDVEALKKAILA